VNRLKPLVAFIVLALWASCAVRCELANLVSASKMACCDDATDQSPETPSPAQHNQCVCSWALSGGYVAQRAIVPPPLLVSLPLFTPPAELEAPQPVAPDKTLSFSPPELLTSWQFSQRAALSPRDPSLVS
jgi:hypothetical protein